MNIFMTEELTPEEIAELTEKGLYNTYDPNADTGDGTGTAGDGTGTMGDGTGTTGDGSGTTGDGSGTTGNGTEPVEPPLDSAGNPVQTPQTTVDGLQIDPENGYLIDPVTGGYLNPITREPVDQIDQSYLD